MLLRPVDGIGPGIALQARRFRPNLLGSNLMDKKPHDQWIGEIFQADRKSPKGFVCRLLQEGVVGLEEQRFAHQSVATLDGRLGVFQGNDSAHRFSLVLGLINFHFGFIHSIRW
jgi:hypothetical protein